MFNSESKIPKSTERLSKLYVTLQQTSSLPPPPPEKSKKSKRRWLIPAVALIVIVLVASVAVYSFSSKPINLTAFNEHLIIYSHSSSGNETVKYNFQLNSYAGGYQIGQQIVIKVPYSYGGSSGTESIKNMTCDTSGFSLVSVSPQLPITLPNTRDNQQPITLTITFNATTTPYNGPFDFTVYYDQYP
jgi:hypothetical protein